LADWKIVCIETVIILYKFRSNWMGVSKYVGIPDIDELVGAQGRYIIHILVLADLGYALGRYFV
jgi:hypothetical protein